MEPSYETVVDISTILWTMSAMLIHGVMLALQLGLIVFLIVTGMLALLAPGLDAPWLRRLGAMRGQAPYAPPFAASRVALGVGLSLPLAAGAGVGLSLAASLATLVLLIAMEKGFSRDGIREGRVARRIAMLAAALVAAFAAWEGEDGLELSVEVLATAQGWRMEELEWQLSNDVEAPKVGDLAPDFELQDPSGESTVRLSDFRGKRPVALVFGSYT